MFNEEPKTQTSHTGPSDNDPVSHLLSGLKRIEAPGDFEFRVRAGIAERNSNKAGYTWLPRVLKLAGPATLLLGLGGYFGIGSLYPPAGDAALVTEVRQAGSLPTINRPPAAEQLPAAGLIVPANQVVADNPPLKTVEAVNRNVTAGLEKRIVPRSETNGSGSYDEASRESQLIPLHNTNPNGSSPNAGRLGVRSVFAALGISASFSTAGWIVGSASGMALRSGVKPGDVIEAVNGQAVKANTSFAGTFTGNSLRVRRDGKVIQISLR